MRRRVFIKSGAMLCLSSMSMVLIGCDLKNMVLGVTAPYPSKPITMIVPFSAGSASDLIARSMEKYSIKYFGQPFITTCKPGGGGILGWNELVSAIPDGYTVGLVNTSALMQPNYGSTRYHYPTALEPLIQIISSPEAAIVLANSPWKNIGEVVEYAKVNPGGLKYAHPGLGTIAHVVGEMFAKAANITIAQVPFQGDSESLAALLGGHVQLIFALPPTIREYVKHGNVRVLALSSTQRSDDPVYKDVPIFREGGYDVVLNNWYGVSVPKMLSQEVKGELVYGFASILHDPEFQNKMENLGMPVDYLGPDEFKKKWDDETERLAKIIKDTGIAAKIASQKN